MARFTWSLLVSTAFFYGELYGFRSEEGEFRKPMQVASSYHSGPLRRGQVQEDSSPSATAGSGVATPSKNDPAKPGVNASGAQPSDPSRKEMEKGASAVKGGSDSGKSQDTNQKEPTGKVAGSDGASDKKQDSAVEAVPDTFAGRPKINCFKYFASSLGSVGGFSPKSNIYRQIYVKARLPDGYSQIVEEVNLKDKSVTQLLSLKIPRVDVMAFENPESSVEGVSLVQYNSNLDNCFHGNGTIMAFPVKRSNKDSEVQMLKHSGRLVTISDLDAERRFWDENSASVINFQFSPFIKRNSNLKINSGERMVAIGRGSNKKPFFTFKYPDSKSNTPASLISYDLNGSSLEKLDLAPGEKFIFSNQKLGKLVYSEKSSKMSLIEFQNWGSGRKNAEFAFDFPKGFFPHQAEFFINFEKRILVASGQGAYFKTFWKTVLVIDYATGVVISKLRLLSGIAGQVALNEDGTFVVAEEVSPESGERIKLHYLDIVGGKWQSLDYKK